MPFKGFLTTNGRHTCGPRLRHMTRAYAAAWRLMDIVAYKPITLSCILFMFIEMKLIHCHSYVMFAMKSMSMCNDQVNYDEIII